MAKRFIDTEYFKHPFVRSLEAPLKVLYAFIFCDCDNSGCWSPDFEIASIYTGQKVTKSDFEKSFKDKYLVLKNGQYFFYAFIEHQYPKGLQDKNPAHKKVIQKLQEHGLIDENLIIIKDPLKTLSSSYKATKGMEEDKDKDMVKEEEESFPAKNKKIPFEQFWQLYGKKIDKAQAKKKWDTLKAADQIKAIEYIPAYKASIKSRQYMRDPCTFINRKTWENEIILPESKKSKMYEYQEQLDKLKNEFINNHYSDT